MVTFGKIQNFRFFSDLDVATRLQHAGCRQWVWPHCRPAKPGVLTQNPKFSWNSRREGPPQNFAPFPMEVTPGGRFHNIFRNFAILARTSPKCDSARVRCHLPQSIPTRAPCQWRAPHRASNNAEMTEETRFRTQTRLRTP